MSNIAVITARSGLKGIKDKNVRMFHEKPLMYYSIEAAKKSNLFDEIMVSTDSEKYATIAREYGAKVPFLRSDKMSSDTAGSWDTVEEVLDKYKFNGMTYDTVCLLQPTSPLRTHSDIIGAYRIIEEKNANAVTSVCLVDHSPNWSMMLGKDMCMDEFRRNLKSIPRQQLDTYYRINGAVYIRKIEYNDYGVKTLSTPEFAYLMERNRSVDIDEEIDFCIAEVLFEQNRE